MYSWEPQPISIHDIRPELLLPQTKQSTIVEIIMEQTGCRDKEKAKDIYNKLYCDVVSAIMES